MAKANLKIVADPAREELRAKILDVANAEREHATIAKAFEVADDRFYAAMGALDAAIAHASLHPLTAAGKLASELLGDTTEADTAERAHASVATAQAEFDALKGAVEILREKQEDARTELENVKFWRAGAVAKVVKTSPEVRAILECYNSARREADRWQRVLAGFNSGMLPAWPSKWNADGSLAESPLPDLPVAQAWRDAIRALETDADAALPEAN